jgi:hypothetical protein
MDGSDVKLICYVCSFWLVFVVLGSVFLGMANNYSRVFQGILIGGSIFQDTQCSKSSCSTSFYVMETFQKGMNTTNTCTVQRMTKYYSYGSCENRVRSLVLGTKRTLYQNPYDHGTCMDATNLHYYNAVGGVLLGLGLALPLLLFCCIAGHAIYEEIVWCIEQCGRLCNFRRKDNSYSHPENTTSIAYAEPVTSKTNNNGFTVLHEVDNL